MMSDFRSIQSVPLIVDYSLMKGTVHLHFQSQKTTAANSYFSVSLVPTDHVTYIHTKIN